MISWAIVWLIKWQVSQSVVGLSVDKFASQSLNVSVDKLADVLVGRSVVWSVG